MNMAAVFQYPELEEYWREFDDIESTNRSDGLEVEIPKTPDEGEQEAAWLNDAGYNSLVNKYRDGEELTVDEVEDMTSTLTSSQVAVVRRRVDSLNATLKKRLKHNIKTDVRDIFPTNGQNPTTNPPSYRLDDTEDDSWQVDCRGIKRRDKGFVRKGEYAMTGQPDEALPKAESGGVEMLSMGPWGTFNRSWPPPILNQRGPLKVISDNEITFDFRAEKKQNQPTKANFASVKDKLGITRIVDLSEADLVSIRSLALIELTALFDANNVVYTRRKGKKLAKESGLFGVSLQTLLEYDQRREPSCRVPLVFREILYYLQKNCLDAEGILRIPGSSARSKQLRRDLEEKLYMGQFRWNDVASNDVAGLMKQFLRELPLPLLTHDYLEAFFQVEHIQGRKKQLQALNLLAILLPDSNRDTLKLLLQFLARVVSHSPQNKMTLDNVSMIMAPNLFVSPALPIKAKDLKEFQLNLATGTCNLMKMLIHYHDLLWTVPAFLIKQVRHQNEQEQLCKLREKSKSKIVGRKDKAETCKRPPLLNEAHYNARVIRVQTPHMTHGFITFQLDEHTMAKDILSKLQSNNSANSVTAAAVNGSTQIHQSKAKHPPYISQIDVKSSTIVADLCLYEVGGNIGHRCLDPNTVMLALYQVNPNAEWIVRKKQDC